MVRERYGNGTVMNWALPKDSVINFRDYIDAKLFSMDLKAILNKLIPGTICGEFR